MKFLKKIKYNIKFKNKFFIKLVFYFGISLLLFSISTGSLFAYMFIRNTVNLNKKNLELRALKLSETLSRTWFSENDPIGHSPQNGNGKKEPFPRRNMRIIEDIAMAEVWIIEAETGLIIQEKKNKVSHDSYLTLPPNAEEAIYTALNGNLNTTENFNEFLEKKSMTTAAPVFKNGEVIGAVLLHSPMENISSALNNGIYTLVLSILLALLLAGISSILFSLSFTKPLNKIKNTALKLAEGNYDAKTDVTQDDEIGDLAKAMDFLAIKLYKSSKESERFEKMRNDFITNISHELRTPVTVIRGSIEAICDGIVTDENTLENFHRQILSDSIHLQNLVNDLIDLNKLQNSDFSIKKSGINLFDVVNNAIRSMNQLASRKNITINFSAPEDTANYLFTGDYQRIRQMIIIIIDNAIKFSPEGRSIDIVLKNGKNCYTLDISDQGTGIPEEELEKIFDRFHKSDSGNNDGMGLGLAIAKQIAIRHNIIPSVKSILNSGTTFSFEFPKKI